MITQYFDLNQRLIIQSPGTLAAATSTPWVYGDNYDLAIYLTAAGIIQPIGVNDTLSLMLFQPAANLPEANLAIVGLPVITTDPAGFQYYLININLATVPLAALVQTPNKSAQCQFHYIFTPADGERFSSSADLAITVNPDPSQSATGATPVPPGYPTSPNVFELIAQKGVASGYAGLDATGKVPTAQLPTSTAGGDMLKSVYDTNNNGIVDTCDTLVSSRVTGLGTAAVVNVPASGNATATQAVLGNDTRLTDNRSPLPHQASHNGGADAIPLATTSAQGLCPPPDGTTIQVVSGKLTATTSGSGNMNTSVYVTGSPTNPNPVDNALAVQTHQVPATGNASGAQLVLATDTRLSDARTPQGHQSTHLSNGSDPIALATTAAAGLCPPPDGTTIQVSGGKLAAILATGTAPGIVKPDGSSITVSGGVLTATSSGLNSNCKVHASAAQALNATPSTMTQITWSAADFQNPSGAWWTSGGLLAVPAGQAGIYIVGACITFAVNATGTQRQAQLKTGGGVTFALANAVAGGAAGVWAPAVTLSGIISLAVGNTVELDAAADVASLNTAAGSFGPVFLWLARIA